METDNQKIYYALCLWANFIQTGDMNLSGQDAINQGKPGKVLTLEQMKMVVRLRELAELALNKKILVQDYGRGTDAPTLAPNQRGRSL